MITIKKADPEDFSSTDVLFQTALWGEFKQKVQDSGKNGQSALYFWANFKYDRDETSNEIIFPLLILMRRGFNGTLYAYAQRAPAVLLPEESKSALLEELAFALREFLPQKTAFLRFDLPWSVPGIKNGAERVEMQELAMNFGTRHHNLRKAPSNHLCPDTVIIDLRPPPQKLLSSMRQQTRNSIRRAYKEDIEFSIYDAQSPSLMENLKEWHKIYEATATRKKFYFEGFDYFKTLFECASKAEKYGEAGKTTKSDRGGGTESTRQQRFEEKSKVPLNAAVPSPTFYLFTACKDNKMLSGLILAICAKRAYYMYAASSLEGRRQMPNYGLQWEAIRFARSKGCAQYDLMGIPQDESKNDPMAGLYIFKTGFGGQKTHFGGTWDFPYKTEEYQAFTLCESMGMKSKR